MKVLLRIVLLFCIIMIRNKTRRKPVKMKKAIPFIVLAVIGAICVLLIIGTKAGSNIYDAQESDSAPAYDKRIALSDSFTEKCVGSFLAVKPDKNTVLSLNNVSLSLEVLSDMTLGDTNDAITTVNGGNTAFYTDDVISEDLSCWINSDLKVKKVCIEELSDKYGMFTCVGDVTSAKMNKIHSDRLADIAEIYSLRDKTFNPDTLMELDIITGFSDTWVFPFIKENTFDSEFYGETVYTVSFMHKTEPKTVYFAKNFSSIAERTSNDYSVYFVLPASDVSLDTVFEDNELKEFLLSDKKKWGQKETCLVEEAVPIFSYDTVYDVSDLLKGMGLSVLFTKSADFAPIFDEEISVSNIYQSTRVCVDENGFTAKTAGIIEILKSDPEERLISFDLNKPFLYFVEDPDNNILYIGTVTEP